MFLNYSEIAQIILIAAIASAFMSSGMYLATRKR